jgi:valyl-tRNA synthetase
LQSYSATDRERVTANRRFIDRLARIESIGWLDSDATAPGAATALLGEMKILVSLAGLVDVTKEIDRLEKQIARLSKDLDLTENKLGNERFVVNAPQEIVDKERERAGELRLRREQLDGQLATLREIR